MLGLWLSGVFAVSLAGRTENHGFVVLAMLGAGLVWPGLYFMLIGRILPVTPAPGTRIALLIFTLFAGASVYVSPIIWMSGAYFLITLAAIFISMQFNTVLSPEQYRRGLAIYACITSILLLCYAAKYYQPGVRLGSKDGGVLNPNSIGMISLSVIATAFSLRRWLFRIAVAGAGAGVLILTDSRSAALGALAAMATILWVKRRHSPGSTKVVFTIALILASAGAAIYWSSIVEVVERFFAVNNYYRGLGTGFTGRLLVWKQTWDLFVDHPLLGVGFRAHEQFVTAQGSSHDGYLATLAEIGLFGFSALLYVIVAGIGRLRKSAVDPRQAPVVAALLAICAGYCFVAIFERYLLNVGNPTSLLFILAILYRARGGHEVSADQQYQKHDAHAGRGIDSLGTVG